MTSFVWLGVVTLIVVQVSVLCTTIYLHRTLTHRGLEVHPALAFCMHLWLMIFTGITPRQWVAVHRKHHQFSDKEGDPHSPYIYGMWTVLFGNVYYYRKTAADEAVLKKYTPDYRGTAIDVIPAQGFGVLAGWAIFVAMFGWAWGSGAFWFQAAAYIFLNASINSICHMVGYRNFDNLATNVQWIALLTGGEGLHNNHHEYPASPRFSMRGLEFDPAWPAIRAMQALRLARVKALPVA
jgi:stearoyl-CoA desaturase (Delta-9 desaturase)